MDAMEGMTLPTDPPTPEYLEDVLQPLFTSLGIFSMVSYSLVFVLGTIGNGLVIFITGFRMKKTVHMIWILNLAMADFSISFFLLFHVIYRAHNFYWPFGPFMCKFLHAIDFLNLFGSIYLLTVISLDRCVSVWCPVWAQNHRTPRLASFVVLGVWIVAFGFSSPNLYLAFTDKTNASYCISDYSLTYEGRVFLQPSFMIIGFVFGFIIPFGVIVVCYVAIVVKLRRGQLSHSSKPFKVITAVIVAFFVCWFPLHFSFILDMLLDYGSPADIAVIVISHLASSLMYFNSCLNPILYFCLGHHFKKRPRCSILSALANAFTEDSSHSYTKTTRTSAELDSSGL